jgi:hypothetical protein
MNPIMVLPNETSTEAETPKGSPMRQLFDIAGSVDYLRELGANGANPWFVRGLIASGRVPHIQIGKKFYVLRSAWDAWLARAERRKRA